MHELSSDAAAGENMMLVGLTGVARSGKDTVGGILVDKLGFERRAFADKLRAVALGADPYVTLAPEGLSPRVVNDWRRLSEVVALAGWEGAKAFPDVRRFLQRLGTEGVRDNLGEKVWIEGASRDLIEDLHRGGLNRSIVFTDVRFPNEADVIRNLGGEIWRITRPGHEALNNHVSEVQPFTPNRIITNNGTLADLRRNVLSIFTPA